MPLSGAVQAGVATASPPPRRAVPPTRLIRRRFAVLARSADRFEVLVSQRRAVGPRHGSSLARRSRQVAAHASAIASDARVRAKGRPDGSTAACGPARTRPTCFLSPPPAWDVGARCLTAWGPGWGREGWSLRTDEVVLVQESLLDLVEGEPVRLILRQQWHVR